MLKQVLVLLVITAVVVARAPIRKKRSCKKCEELSISSSEGSSWSKQSAPSSEETDGAFPCDKNLPDDSASNNRIVIDLGSGEKGFEKNGRRTVIKRLKIKNKIHRVVTCQGGEMRMECGQNERIRVVRGNYGRTCNTECLSGTGLTNVTDCYCDSALEIMRELCDGARLCGFYINLLFYSMCPEANNYATAEYICIPDTSCPDKENMVFTVCAPCEQSTCTDMTNNYVPNDCIPGCVCTGTLVLDPKSQKCVEPSMCPYYDAAHPNCDGNDVYYPNATRCEPTCEQPDPQDPCPYPVGPGYNCPPPTIRREPNGQCIDKCSCSPDSPVWNQ